MGTTNACGKEIMRLTVGAATINQMAIKPSQPAKRLGYPDIMASSARTRSADHSVLCGLLWHTTPALG
jgi:hypothetical protein